MDSLTYMKKGYVYIITNETRSVLYTGVTSDPRRRIYNHKQGSGGEFASRYRVFILLYIEEHPAIMDAIVREKQIKKWKREWKMNLIKSINPDLKDLWREIINHP